MDIPAILIAVPAILAPTGTAIMFVWNKLEKRFLDLEAKLGACEARDRTNGERRTLQLAVIRLLISAIESVSPKNAVLDQAHALLNDAMVTDAVATAATEAAAA